jgi:hypothetical protein
MNGSGKIEKYPGVKLEIDKENTANFLGIQVISNNTLVGYIGIKFFGSPVYVVPTSLLS